MCVCVRARERERWGEERMFVVRMCLDYNTAEQFAVVAVFVVGAVHDDVLLLFCL